MTRTATHSAEPSQDASTPGVSVAPPPRLRRRPTLMAAGVVAVCLGALLAGWAWAATTNTQSVIVARHLIERGSVIEASDLARVRLSVDPAVKPVAGDDLSGVVGQRATVDIADGALLTPDSFGELVVPGSGRSVVGVALAPERGPGSDLHTGDQVRVVVTSADGESATGTPAFHDAEVADVHVSTETGQVVVDLLVPHADAPLVAAQAATGQVAIVLDSRER